MTFTRADIALILLAPSAVLPGCLKRSTRRRNAARAWYDRMVTPGCWSKRLVHEAESSPVRVATPRATWCKIFTAAASQVPLHRNKFQFLSLATCKRLKMMFFSGGHRLL
jgi:hypothetical protein